MIGWLLLVLGGSVILFLVAVWFGQQVVATRITRALDRTDAEEGEAGERHD